MSTGAKAGPAREPPNLVRAAAQQISLIAAILYFAGWVYLDRYYSYYDIDVSLLDVGWSDILVYSGAMLNNAIYSATRSPYFYIIVIAMIAIIILEQRIDFLSALFGRLNSARLGYVLPITATLLILAGSVYLSKQVATAQAERDWILQREPAIFSLNEKCTLGEHFDYANSRLLLSLFKTAPKWHFAIQRDPEQSPGNRRQIRIYHIPTSCIVLVRREFSPYQ